MVPQVPWEWTLGRGVVAPPMREDDLVARDDASRAAAPPSAPRSSATASAPGTTWMAGMPAAPAVALVHLERDAGGGVDERGQQRVGLARRGRAAWRPAREAPLGHGAGEARVLGLRAARHHGAERVEQHQPGAPQRRARRGARATHRPTKAASAIQIVACARARSPDRAADGRHRPAPGEMNWP